MFDAQTAALLRSAPELPGLDPQNLPALLTFHYANLASYRLSGIESAGEDSSDWPLQRIADTYELTAVLQAEPQTARAAAFVAATAQQILARIEQEKPHAMGNLPNIDKDRLDPALSAVLLFMLSEQFADANEATAAIRPIVEGQLYEATILTEHIADLGTGRLHDILGRSERWRRPRVIESLEERALAALMETIATGIELFAANFLREPAPGVIADRYESPRLAFERVIELSAGKRPFATTYGPIDIVYAGTHHLASLLLAATDGISSASLMNIPPPDGADENDWNGWLRYRSKRFPYMWPNHRQAVQRDFHETGVSSVVVLPTGAGKTTVSSLKIAGVLARGKKVVFLAPTHALVEQLTEDLQEMFPKDLLGSVVSSDFDLLLQEDAIFQDVEVMTPERCLAMLSFAQEAFKDVGLLVFDECHLLSPESGKIRRALDGMLCVLGFNHVAPEADILFLSAMVKNGTELAGWLKQLTGRKTVDVDLIWKPSRQARGVVIYDSAELETAKANSLSKQQQEDQRLGKTANSLRKVAKEALLAQPYAIWGLQHNWLSGQQAFCSTTPLLRGQVNLAGNLKDGPSVWLTPNANSVASQIASVAASKGLKTIVFVNTKNDAVKVAGEISDILDERINPTEKEELHWIALELELGGLRHSLLPGPAAAVPHNSAMLRLERDLAERMFKRSNGAKVIVATPTLAQGLNLPAHFAILAGDKRASAKGGRESLEAHEILNAAARAGRAGHLANGLVLLVPEPIIDFKQTNNLSHRTVEKLKAVLPEDDHCVTIADPLQTVLDRVNVGETADPQVKYTINRFANLPAGNPETIPDRLFDLKKSLAAHIAQNRSEADEFEAKLETFTKAVEEYHSGGLDETTAILASQSGLSSEIVLRLRDRIVAAKGKLPIDIPAWISWMTEWLIEDKEACNELLGDTKAGILSAAGKTQTDPLDEAVLRHILPGILSWIAGAPLSEIDRVLGGEPSSPAITKRTCPRARALASAVIPRGYSFVLGLVAHVVKELDPFDKQEDLDQQVVEVMSTALRLGFDTADKLFFARDNKDALGRVQAHLLWQQQSIVPSNFSL
ncbi:DEAD/DEAH box helicase [Ruegeria sp. 1NDH52C]|uniref:DEAD/DEAH box helicase n=1 Tax=Ruegeria alba TaxID=2916756 RepID=A0ABS9P2L7_9RHOB|nr:DEAD/DEAH box helicase [Ruegeria alba]MCG6560729.1 DEAD/DEAH box helicase [Ruegeria alba]